MTGRALDDRARPDTGGIPDLIREAGETAVFAYTSFFKQGAWKPGTRKLYSQNARRFFRWAAARGLSLESITADEIAVYAAENGSRAGLYLTPVRGMFRRLVSAGVLRDDPFSESESGDSPSAERGFPEPRIPYAELKLQVLELIEEDGSPEDSEYFRAGMVMLSPASLGTTDPRAISRFTGVPLPQVREFAGRLQANGCWSGDGKLVVDSDDPDECFVSLLLTLLVALGKIERCPVPDGDAADAAPVLPSNV